MKTSMIGKGIYSHLFRPPLQHLAWRSRANAVWLTLIAGLLATVTPARPALPGVSGQREVDVMQVNLYVGGGIDRAIALDPTDPNYFANLIGTVTGIYYEIVASDPSVRIQRVADEIGNQLPDLVSVEEASLIRLESPGDLVLGGSNPATNIVYDYLQILVSKLNAQGAHYGVAAVTIGMDVEMPMLNLQTGSYDDARLTDREAILVRTDLPPGQLRVKNPQGANFKNVIVTDAGLPLLYGWCAVDVSIRGRDFRYICAHLMTESAPQIQVLQAQELLAGPAKVKLPVLIVGDFNSDPFGRDGSGGLAHSCLIGAGFKDAWDVLHPGDSEGGLTWGHDEYLAEPSNSFDRRIDQVFYKGTIFMPTTIEVNDLWLDQNEPPFWASDHAAVTSNFLLR